MDRKKVGIVLVIVGVSIVIFSAVLLNRAPQTPTAQNNESNVTTPTPTATEAKQVTLSGSVTPSTNEPGKYIAYSQSALTDKTNVIFFHANWCPFCVEADKKIKAELTSIPSQLTILKANYDSETALKKKYGVTYQHTFVQVDKDGNLIKKWSGSYTIAEILAQIK
jgi:thiol-disulfide isomerase/thioredoxin